MRFLKTVVAMTFAVLLIVALNGFSKNEYLKAVPDVFDFGAVEEGGAASVTVTVQNTGTSPVEVTNVKTN